MKPKVVEDNDFQGQPNAVRITVVCVLVRHWHSLPCTISHSLLLLIGQLAGMQFYKVHSESNLSFQNSLQQKEWVKKFFKLATSNH